MIDDELARGSRRPRRDRGSDPWEWRAAGTGACPRWRGRAALLAELRRRLPRRCRASSRRSSRSGLPARRPERHGRGRALVRDRRADRSRRSRARRSAWPAAAWQAGDRAGAIAAYERVPDTSSGYVDAQIGQDPLPQRARRRAASRRSTTCSRRGRRSRRCRSRASSESGSRPMCSRRAADHARRQGTIDIDGDGVLGVPLVERDAPDSPSSAPTASLLATPRAVQSGSRSSITPTESGPRTWR